MHNITLYTSNWLTVHVEQSAASRRWTCMNKLLGALGVELGVIILASVVLDMERRALIDGEGENTGVVIESVATKATEE